MRRKPGWRAHEGQRAGAGVRCRGRGREMGNEGAETGGGQEPGWGLKGGRKQRESEAGKDRNLGDGKDGAGHRGAGEAGGRSRGEAGREGVSPVCTGGAVPAPAPPAAAPPPAAGPACPPAAAAPSPAASAAPAPAAVAMGGKRRSSGPRWTPSLLLAPAGKGNPAGQCREAFSLGLGLRRRATAAPGGHRG